VRGQVNLAIWRTLKSHGVEIPFPQRVVQWAADKEASSVPRREAPLAPTTKSAAEPADAQN
jgi:small-conductance mechanosensitive channel